MSLYCTQLLWLVVAFFIKLDDKFPDKVNFSLQATFSTGLIILVTVKHVLFKTVLKHYRASRGTFPISFRGFLSLHINLYCYQMTPRICHSTISPFQSFNLLHISKAESLELPLNWVLKLVVIKSLK